MRGVLYSMQGICILWEASEVSSVVGTILLAMVLYAIAGKPKGSSKEDTLEVRDNHDKRMNE